MQVLCLYVFSCHLNIHEQIQKWHVDLNLQDCIPVKDISILNKVVVVVVVVVIVGYHS